MRDNENLKECVSKDVTVVAAIVKPVSTSTIIPAIRIRSRTPFGNMHVTISVDPKTDREMEVFAQIGKAGDIPASDLEAICRMVSLFLRSGGSLEQVIGQLEGIGSSISIHTKDGKMTSIGDVLGKTMRKYLQAKKSAGLRSLLLGETSIDTVKAEVPKAPLGNHLTNYKIKCPACHDGTLVFTEGCAKCMSCDHSQC